MVKLTSGFIERALTYGAVSYGFGFLVVMVHTWRLGLPVIALLDPIYVWLGLPFAIIAFYGTPIVTSVRQRAADARASIARAFSASTSTPVFVTDVATTLASNFPVLPFAFDINVMIYRIFLAWLLSRLGEKSESTRVEALITALSGLFRFVRTLAYLAILGFLLILYVWQVYPQLPKSLGGGAPNTVRMILSREALPSTLLSELGARPSGVLDKSAQTEPTMLLYSTSNSHYVRTRAGRIVSLSASAVNAIIWNDSANGDPQSIVPTVSLLMSVHFGSNRTSVANELDQSLRDFAARVKNVPEMCVRLDGHADVDGSAEYNLALSRLRVEAVLSILEREGLSKERLVTVPHGSVQPQVEGRSESSKAQNRRVDLSVVPCAHLVK